MNRTTTATPDTIEKAWHLVDATDLPIGRMAAQIAQILRGKHKTSFTPNLDCGDFVVVVNAEKAIWTGGKGKELLYRHSGWPGGIKSMSREDYLEKKPTELIEKVVWGMLPQNALGRQMLTKLKVYCGSEHPHSAQSPTPLDVRKKR